MKGNKTNKNAIYSIIFSSISFVIFWWLSISGLCLGIKALAEIKINGEKGKALAIIGIVLGIIALVLYTIGKII